MSNRTYASARIEVRLKNTHDVAMGFKGLVLSPELLSHELARGNIHQLVQVGGCEAFGHRFAGIGAAFPCL